MNAQMAGPTALDEQAPRHYELDWLRTLVVLGIIPYHALVIFGASSAVYIKSAQSAPALALIGGFALTWGIPTIFLMSGAATRLALEHRTPGAVVRERLGRLLVPLALVALVFSPVQAYFILLSNPSLISMSPVPIQHPEQLRSFGEFYRTYLTILVTTVRAYSPSIGTLALAHVWFIPRLLVVTLLTLLLVLCLRRYMRRTPEWVARLGRRPAFSLFGAGLMTALVVALLRPGWLEHITAHWLFTDVWSEFFLDLALFLCGYLIYSSRQLRATVYDLSIPALLLGLLCWAADAVVTHAGKAPSASFAPTALAYTAAWALSAWLVSVALLGLAMRYLAFSSPLQRYLTYAAFPVYLLHLSVLTISAYYLLRLPLPWYIQLLLITGVTVLVAFGVFDLVIRRTPVTRFLFGVKARWSEGTGLGVRQTLPQPPDSHCCGR
jgi:glucan biosynthesis protein C